MKIKTIGRAMLLLIGFAFGIKSIYPEVLPTSQLIVLLVFGFLGLGLGSFGLEFMEKYGDWLDKIGGWIGVNRSDRSYEKLFESVAQGEMPEKLQGLAMNYALHHPIDGLERILEGVIQRTPDYKAGRNVLEKALQDFQNKKKSIDALLKTAPTVQQARQFDIETRTLIHIRLRELSEDEVRALGIDPSQIPAYAPDWKK